LRTAWVTQQNCYRREGKEGRDGVRECVCVKQKEGRKVTWEFLQQAIDFRII
jgi:hypothetical protein